MPWDSQQYLRFEAQRTQPCRDLVRRIPLEAPAAIVDLGCGPGNSTAELRDRWPDAKITGVDNSAPMLDRARADHPGIEWINADIGAWTPAGPVDLIFSNAALQWVPRHRQVFPHLLGHVAPGGFLAVQMPANIDALPHRLMQELAASPDWQDYFPHQVREWDTREASDYYDILAPHSNTLDIWMTTYLHVLPDAAAVVEWYKGTGLRPWLDALPGEAERERFIADYAARVARYYHPRPDGKVLFPFERLFLLASPQK